MPLVHRSDKSSTLNFFAAQSLVYVLNVNANFGTFFTLCSLSALGKELESKCRTFPVPLNFT